MLKPYPDTHVKRYHMSLSQVITLNSDLVKNDQPFSLLLITAVRRYIYLLVSFAFVKTVSNVAGLYQAVANGDKVRAISVGCHNSDTQYNGQHDELCSSGSVVPWHMCAILIALPYTKLGQNPQTLNDLQLNRLVDYVVGAEPDPPKNSPFLNFMIDAATDAAMLPSFGEDRCMKPVSERCASLYEGKDHAVIGVSPFNTYFSEERLTALFKWAHESFAALYG